jgi:hypothetical protein
VLEKLDNLNANSILAIIITIIIACLEKSHIILGTHCQ